MSHVIRHHNHHHLLTCCLLWIAAVAIQSQQITGSSTKPGLCPLASKVQPSSRDAAHLCRLDDDCPRDFKCCATSASIFGEPNDRVCIMPLPSKTACEHQRDAADNIARSVGPSALNFLPECVPGSGTFAPIQCSAVMDRCWCVDGVGFEVPGTRVAYGKPLNCTSPRVCPNPECRMFCAHGFKLDERDGCPLCQCRNPCDEVRCPRSSQCILEEVNCISDPCPPVSQCMARSLELQCPFGPALADKSSDGSALMTTFICSNKPNIIGRSCPLNTYDCIVEDGKDYGMCCPRNGTLNSQEDSITTITIQQPDIPTSGSACLLQRGYMIDRALQQFAPKCDMKTGNFEQIQCDFNDEHCYCVDTVTGDEIIGTRRRHGLQPNCSAPTNCALPTCDPNLKCEHGFEFDINGCPVCQCYDPCSESECPSDLCRAVNVDCMRPPCPLIASCKEARSLSNPCHIGRPLVDVHSNDFHICGQFPQAQACPQQYTCEIIDAEGHGLCCLSSPSSSLPSAAVNLPSRSSAPSLTVQDAVSESQPSSLRTVSSATAGQCPVSSSNHTIGHCDNEPAYQRCKLDADCQQNQKCCEHACGGEYAKVCRQIVTKTQCLLQQEAVDDAQRLASLSTQGGALGNFRPQCLESNGAYARVQCNTSWCWCVNDAGLEFSTLTNRVERERVGDLNCTGNGLEARSECGLQCRMYCPHGFVLNPQTGCPECECRSPCNDLKCPAGHECQLYDIECSARPCLAIAKCFPIVQPNPCVGNTEPLRDPVANTTVRCDLRDSARPDIHGAVPSCPLNYECRHAPQSSENSTGVCCQRQSEDICMQPADVGVCQESLPRWHFNYQSKECEPFLWGGCGGNLNNFKTFDMCQLFCKDTSSATSSIPNKNELESLTTTGHCPVPQLVDGNSCRKECAVDNDCPGANVKCCSNGCGTKCIQADFKTACQQLRIAATRMQRNLIPNIAQFASSHFVPRCQESGEFEHVQCDAGNKWCWCVSPQGMELDGTRQLRSDRIACEVGRAINPINLCALDQPQCRMLCPFGFKRNETTGCPVCECVEPCESFQCPAHTYCDIIGVDCTTPPCPAVPTCVPQPIRSVAECAGGDEPLRRTGSDAFATCQDDVECPSTHSCTFALSSSSSVSSTTTTEPTTMASGNVSMETTGVCCKKTKNVCSLPMVVGPCRAALTRFYFDHTIKQCKQFTYGGCHENENNFFTAEECAMVCLPLVPPLTTTTILPAVSTTAEPTTHARSSLSTTDNSIFVPAVARDAAVFVAGHCPNNGQVLQPFTNGPQDDPSNFCDDHSISCPLSHTCLPANNNASFICCPKTVADCQLTPDPGMCRGGFPRWFFSQKTRQCEMFLFGGCDGNSNNFANKVQCQQVCGALGSAVATSDAASCETRRKESIASNSSLLAYVPQCDENDSALYNSMQCVDSVGLCWCVSQANGKKISPAKLRGELNCTEVTMNERTGRVLAPMDSLIENEQIIDVCNGRTTSDTVPVFASSALNVQRTVFMHECEPTVCKHKVCLAYPQAQCRVNPCSSSATEQEICEVEFFVGVQKVNCSETLTRCESELQSVVNSEVWKNMRQPLPLRRVKQISANERFNQTVNFHSGQCPPFFTLGRSDSNVQCQQQCRADSDCGADEQQKCCFNGCGTVCTTALPTQPPTAAEDSKILMPLYIPQCSSYDGKYESKQCAGNLCWCVADGRENGQPILNSTSRGAGTLKCGASASNTEQQAQRALAANALCGGARGGSLDESLCTSACLTATCPTHPEALCVADPCQSCQVKFVDAVGQDVDCRPACEQPLSHEKCVAEAGVNQIVPRFYYNSAAQQCKMFNFSTTCVGNDNNFATMEDCRHECLASDPCDQPKSEGVCRASIPRWYYNKQTRKCEQFTYGGCRGNQNNFQTQADCETTCPARVTCPRVHIAQNNSITATTCSRRTACAAASDQCAHPLAICDVDACRACAPIFKDIWGRRVQCDKRPHKCAVEYMERMVMADAYHPQCEGDKYAPTQCQQDHSSNKCWCVDEAGEAVEEKNYFSSGDKSCVSIPINTTIVRLRFDTNKVDTVAFLNLLRQELSQILTKDEQQGSNALKVDVKAPKNDSNLVELRLEGQSGVDVAYFLAKRNELRANRMNNLFVVDGVNLITSISVEHERALATTSPAARSPAVVIVSNDITDDAKNSSENLVNIKSIKTPAIIENDASMNEIDSQHGKIGQDQHYVSAGATWKYLLPIFLILAIAVLSLLVVGGLLYRRKHCGSYGTRRVAAARAAAANAATLAEASNAADVPPRTQTSNLLSPSMFAPPSTVIITPLHAGPNVVSSTTHRVSTMTTTGASLPSNNNYLSLFAHDEEAGGSPPSSNPLSIPNAAYDSSPETGRSRTYASSLTNSTSSSNEHNNATTTGAKTRLNRQQTPFSRK